MGIIILRVSSFHPTVGGLLYAVMGVGMSRGLAVSGETEHSGRFMVSVSTRGWTSSDVSQPRLIYCLVLGNSFFIFSGYCPLLGT